MKGLLVLQTDFGLVDGAVSAMYGVALSVDRNLKLYDLTHEIPPYHIWEGSYRLFQTLAYWPEETVFVSVVDPGVGTDRLSLVVKTKTNHYIVTPNNGTLTHIAEHFGIDEIRKIDEEVHRLPNSGESYTFHGRDIYAYTAAKLAAGQIGFSEVGPLLPLSELVLLAYPRAKLINQTICGNIDIQDIRFGNLWTNVERAQLLDLGITYGDYVEVIIEHHHGKVYRGSMVFTQSFANCKLGEALLYVNSVDKLGLAINQGSFAQAYHIGSGADWKISIRKHPVQKKAVVS